MSRPVQLDPDTPRTFRFEIKKASIAQRLDVYLTKRLPEYSRTLLQRFLKDGAITVNDRVRKAGYEIGQGDVIDGRIPRLILPQLIASDIPLQIVYEDDWMLAINKPPNFVVHPGAGHWEDTLVNALLHHCGSLPTTDDVYRPGIVHRLDKDTSGVILAAKTQGAHVHLAAQFEQRRVEKEYHAIVEGELDFDADVIEKEIAHHKKHFDKMAVVRDGLGKEASSSYEVLERFDGFTYLKVLPKTGRQHQIRVHLAAIRHPCVADSTYAGRDSLFVRDLDPKAADADLELISRQALHAARIRVTHPETGEPVEFTAPLADDMSATLDALRRFRAEPPE